MVWKMTDNFVCFNVIQKIKVNHTQHERTFN